MSIFGNVLVVARIFVSRAPSVLVDVFSVSDLEGMTCVSAGWPLCGLRGGYESQGIKCC